MNKGTKHSMESVKSHTTTKAMASFTMISLDKFCSKKMFQLGLITPLTPQDNELVQQIVDTGKKFEHISGVTFISQEDVIEVTRKLVHNDPSLKLPAHIMDTYNEENFEPILESLQKKEFVSLPVLAHLTKLTIIESMYSTYIEEVTKMEKRRRLDGELARLVKVGTETETGGKKGKKKEQKTSKTKLSKVDNKSKLSSKRSQQISRTDSTKAVSDYTEIDLDENELVSDFDVDNHVMYFVLSGFSDPLIISEIFNLNITISAVIEVSSELSDRKNLNSFVAKLNDLLEYPKKSRFLESTVVLKYQNRNHGDSKKTLEEFLDVVKRVNYMKRLHLYYTRHLKFYNFGDSSTKIELRSMEKYNRMMNEYKPELVSVSIILNALIEDICWRELGPIYSISDLSVDSGEGDNTDAFFHREEKPYQVHEWDFLQRSIKEYKEIGRKCYDTTLKYMQLLYPFKPMECTSRTQDKGVSTEEDCYCDHHACLWDYFHLAIFSQMKRQPFIPKPSVEYDLVTNLVTYDEESVYRKLQPNIPVDDSSEDNDVIANYHIKEDLSKPALYQFISSTLKYYAFCDRFFCEESNATLLRFHNNLDEFGLNTILWTETLRTPVCLRDFCRFVMTEDRQWFEKHKPEEHSKLFEVDTKGCTGLKDIRVSSLYQEYQHLLEVPSELSTAEKKQLFDDILSELANYPRNTIQEHRQQDEAVPLLAYDLDVGRVQLTGHTTTFQSDDGVKVVVDTSRFLFEDFKCSVNIMADKHSLFFHTANPTRFHFVLGDRTVVYFKKLSFQESVKVCSKENVGKKMEEVHEEKKGHEVTLNDYWVQLRRKSQLASTIPNFTAKRPIPLQTNDENLEKLLELFKMATEARRPIYKISLKSSVKCLKRVSSSLSVPFVGILHRILFKPNRKKRKIRGYNVVLNDHEPGVTSLTHDFSITLPNGLYITSLPRNRAVVEVNQSYRFGKYKEEYRIYYSTGFVLIKNADGTTTILRSNGDIIELTDIERSSTDCRKNIEQIFKREEDEACSYRASRWEDDPSSKVASDFSVLHEFSDIPYKRMTILESTGRRKVIFEGHVTTSQLYYVIRENDYHTGERFLYREDGMRCIIDRKGKHIFQFPDGTKITTWPEVEKELLVVDPRREGWVSVIIIYKFEHPDYSPVIYNGLEKTTNILLKDANVRISNGSHLVTIDKNIVTPGRKISVQVTSDSILYKKTCEHCDSDCICKIHWKRTQNDKLLELTDSYNKNLCWDYRGNCHVDPDYIKTAKNIKGCDHRRKNERQRFFILNHQGPPGTYLWRDSSVENRLGAAKNCRDIRIASYVNMLTHRQTYEIFTDIYQNFRGWFTMSQEQLRKIGLSKRKSEEVKLFCVLFRVLIQIPNLQWEPELLSALKELLECSEARLSSYLLDGIRFLLQYVSDFKKIEIQTAYCRLSLDQAKLCCVKGQSEETISTGETVSIIIETWRAACAEYRNLIRNKKFAPYFQSEYYHNVMSSK